jgi:hypothetical protein
VEVSDDATGTLYFFPCNAWLDKGQGGTEKVLPVADPSTAAGAAKLTYKVTVTTSDIRFAGTDANVFVEIVGERCGLGGGGGGRAGVGCVQAGRGEAQPTWWLGE